MFGALERGDQVFQPSQYWRALNDQNVRQLESHGIANCKRTVAQNYFTWVVGWLHEQFRFLVRHTRLRDWPRIVRSIQWTRGDSGLPRRRWLQLQLFTLMMWLYARRNDRIGALADIAEPETGNPFRVMLDGGIVSQDLANSSLELNAIAEHFAPARTDEFRVLEIGAGYGRDAYLFLSLFPRCRYVIVDIPPALYVSQQYLTAVFPERRFFGFQPFADVSPFERDILAADCAFLLPHQAAQLPPHTFDLALNISSLHEMTLEQIRAYIALVDRLAKGFFYTKQWLVSTNRQDGIVIRRDDYPIPAHWRVLFDRRAPVQTSFFEAMYAVALDLRS